MRAAGLPEPATLITPEVVRRGRPHPDGYLLAAQQLEADPEECVVIEDAPAGVEAGLAAGMSVIAVLTTHNGTELDAATWQVESIADVRGLIDALPQLPA